MKVKQIISALLVIVFTLSLLGCTENKVTRDEAREQANLLVNAVSSGNFSYARELLHPSLSINIEEYFNTNEEKYGVDFQSGITVERYTNFSSALYDSDVKGSEYELDIDISVSGKTLELTIDVVRNEQGFGIYEIEIDD